MHMKKAIEVSRREFLAGCGTVVGSAVLAAGTVQAHSEAGTVRFGVRTKTQ
jgi:hypothetical protein